MNNKFHFEMKVKCFFFISKARTSPLISKILLMNQFLSLFDSIDLANSMISATLAPPVKMRPIVFCMIFPVIVVPNIFEDNLNKLSALFTNTA